MTDHTMTMPNDNSSFPAQRITTPLEWADLVLNDQVMEQIGQISNWLRHGRPTADDGALAKNVTPGYHAVFCGPPGTGKTLTAALIGKGAGTDVYRIDVSQVLLADSAEAEKGMDSVFAMATDSAWILLLDIPGALFTTRGAELASPQIAYLEQRIASFPGLLIAACRSPFADEAFLQSFRYVVVFEMPAAGERLRLWQNAFSGACTLAPDVDLHQIAGQYELTGGAIINVSRYCALTATQQQVTLITNNRLIAGIERELKK